MSARLKNKLPTTLLSSLGICAFAFLSSGCTDGPFFAMTAMNPYYRDQWKSDRNLGPTYEDRLTEVRLLQEQLTTYEPAEQQRWISDIDTIVRNDPSIEMRRQAILALRNVNVPESIAVLQKASTDESIKVRMAVATSLATLDSDEAVPLLSTLAKDDANTSVRAAAIRALGDHPTEPSFAILASVLDDLNAAIQLQSTLSLTKITGNRELGGDVPQWREFVSRGTPSLVSDPSLTIADRAASMLDWTR
jgi:HEAT repeat protein